jgi:hypothetical protein
MHAVPAESRWIALWAALLIAFAFPTTAAAGSPAQSDCTDAQKKELERYLVGRTITAKIDLPVVNYPGLWVYWNGQYDVESYAESLEFAPAAVLQGESARIDSLRITGSWIGVNVNGNGMHPVNNQQAKLSSMSREELFRRGSQVAVTFGRDLTESDCRIESVLRALSGVMDVAGTGADDPEPDLPGTLIGPSGTGGAVGGESPGVSIATLRLITARVLPTVFKPGTGVQLNVSFEVAGLAANELLEVVEERQLFFEGRPLFSAPRSGTSRWGNGSQATTLEFRFPDSAAPGIYIFLVTLRAADSEFHGAALFQVARN